MSTPITAIPAGFANTASPASSPIAAPQSAMPGMPGLVAPQSAMPGMPGLANPQAADPYAAANAYAMSPYGAVDPAMMAQGNPAALGLAGAQPAMPQSAVPQAVPVPGSAAPPAAPKELNFKTLKVGSSGKSVTRMQGRLSSLGISFGAKDGKFGASDKKAIANFQKRNKLEATGIADKATLNLLEKRVWQKQVKAREAIASASLGASAPVASPGFTPGYPGQVTGVPGYGATPAGYPTTSGTGVAASSPQMNATSQQGVATGDGVEPNQHVDNVNRTMADGYNHGGVQNSASAYMPVGHTMNSGYMPMVGHQPGLLGGVGALGGIGSSIGGILGLGGNTGGWNVMPASSSGGVTGFFKRLLGFN